MVRCKTAALAVGIVLGSACGRTALSPPAPGAPDSLALPFDPGAGCRSFSTEGCAQCCLPAGGDGGCNIQRPYASEFSRDPCPADCAPCARCSDATASSLTNAGKHPRSDCDCATMDPGIDPCMTPEGCGCFCAGLAVELAACPQLGASVCGHGNHCGAVVVAAPGPYHIGDPIAALWINFDNRPVFLDACGNLGIGTRTGMAWQTVAPPAACATGDATIVLARGQSWPVTVTAAGADYAWVALSGAYYLGCTSGVPPSATTCSAGPIEVVEGIEVLR